ncbi:MAG: hypothetical protein J0L58_09720 [Burkholderiales bacterium]|nr:hypothetical protein [Burkholderiales bacterium]
MSPSPNPTQPWYRQRITWLVVGLPLIAVAASFTTLFIAIGHPDPVIKSTAAAAEERPAVEGRNHAQTGGRPQAAEGSAGR